MTNEEVFLEAFDNVDIRERIVEILYNKNEGLLYHTIKKYKTTGVDRDDLLSLCKVGFVKGVGTFDVSKGSKFATYVLKVMENEVLYYLRRNKKHRTVLSIHDVTYITKKDGSTLHVLDTLTTNEDISEDVLEGIEYVERGELLEKALKVLTLKELEILSLYQEGKTQTEISGMVGRSQPSVSKILKKSIKKLRLALGVRCSDDVLLRNSSKKR